MKKYLDIEGVRIISEPGDATRYDYIVIRNGDEYKFVSYNNEFKYPERIDKYSAERADLNSPNDPIIRGIAVKYQCNPFTVRECIRTILEYERKGK